MAERYEGWSSLQRQAERDRIRREALARAEREALVTGRSIKCFEFGNHAPKGCQNDGAGCLCSCHDREWATSLYGPERADQSNG